MNNQTSFKLQEWQGILAAYAILLVGAQTSIAPLATLMAWGLAITYVLDAAANKGQLISSLFQGTGSSLSNTQAGSQIGGQVPGTGASGAAGPVGTTNTQGSAPPMGPVGP